MFRSSFESRVATPLKRGVEIYESRKCTLGVRYKLFRWLRLNQNKVKLFRQTSIYRRGHRREHENPLSRFLELIRMPCWNKRGVKKKLFCIIHNDKLLSSATAGWLTRPWLKPGSSVVEKDTTLDTLPLLMEIYVFFSFKCNSYVLWKRKIFFTLFWTKN